MTCFSVFCLYLYTSLSPSISLPHSLIHSFIHPRMQACIHSTNILRCPVCLALCWVVLGAQSFIRTSSPHPAWRLPPFSPITPSKTYPQRSTHCLSWTAVGGLSGLQSPTMGNPVVSWPSPYSAFRQPSTCSAAPFFTHFWFPSHFLSPQS